MDIAAWLRCLGLEQYESAFRVNEIDASLLATLTVEDLKDLGITRVGHRRRLLNAIAALHREGVASSDTSAERRQLTVMFCDLVGSTALSARFDPEDLGEVIGAYHRTVAETVARFAGYVARYMGDGALVLFGYPQAHEDDAERAVRAGLAVIEAIVGLRTRAQLRVRLGIASGLVVVGDFIGQGAARERNVVGETPNLAARLQALAKPGTMVVADSTRRQIGALFEVEDLGPQFLAGFDQPQRAWRVLGESSVFSRFEALRSGTTPLIGRDDEIDLLLGCWKQVVGGEGQVVLVSGEPGIGKSRLTSELAERLKSQPHIRLRYSCSPHYEDSALYPFTAQLERAAGFARDDAAGAKRGKLESLLAAGARGREDIELVAELLLLPNEADALNLSSQQKREKVFEALLRQLASLAGGLPVLMAFEDAQWIDPTSRELMGLTIQIVRHLPVLLVVTHRPEFQHRWGGEPHVTLLELSRLGERDGAALVQNLAGHATLEPTLVAEIVERTDGIPLFVEELTKAVLESADRETRVVALLAASPAAQLAIPAALYASLTARLDRLGPAAKDVAQIGAVLGREFTYELLHPVSNRRDLDVSLRRLADADLLSCRGLPPHSSYLFKPSPGPVSCANGSTVHRSILVSFIGLPLRTDYGVSCRKPQKQPKPVSRSPKRAAGQDAGVAGLALMSWALWAAGYPDAAVARINLSLDRADSIGHPHGFGHWRNLSFLVQNICTSLLDPDSEALDAVETALESLRLSGYQMGITALYVLQCEALLERHQFARANSTIGEAHETVRRTGEQLKVHAILGNAIRG